MRVAELWRYPVKSLAGEQLQEAGITSNGIAGDRIVHVQNGGGKVVTARTRPRLLGLRGSWDASSGEPLVDALPWRSADVAEAVRRAAGPEAHLVRHDGPERFDRLPLLVATDGSIRELGVDRRHAGTGPGRLAAHRPRVRRPHRAGLRRGAGRPHRHRRSRGAALRRTGRIACPRGFSASGRGLEAQVAGRR